MKVLVTGAAGKIGRDTCIDLHEAGHEVVAVDRIYTSIPEITAHVLELDVPGPLYEIMADAEALVHLANYPSAHDEDFTLTYNNNVIANMNAFHVAANLGIKRIVFASSIQACSSEAGRDTRPAQIPYLPLDGDLPQVGERPYALSKIAGEHALRYFCEQFDIAGFALRFPYCIPMAHSARAARRYTDADRTIPSRVDEVGAYLMTPDAAALIRLCLEANHLTGYRVYLPAAPNPNGPITPHELIDQFYAHVPLRRPIAEIDSLVDITRITEETGWMPELIMPDCALTD